MNRWSYNICTHCAFWHILYYCTPCLLKLFPRVSVSVSACLKYRTAELHQVGSYFTWGPVLTLLSFGEFTTKNALTAGPNFARDLPKSKPRPVGVECYLTRNTSKTVSCLFPRQNTISSSTTGHKVHPAVEYRGLSCMHDRQGI